MNDDMELVRAYAARQSEPAFETLVQRHAGLVYSAALRYVRDTHLAEEITQSVFVILARKAGSLGSNTILAGWLYRTTRYVSSAALKLRRRREQREQEAHLQTMTDQPDSDAFWEQLSPLLNEAMAQLRDQDHDAIVLRYFQNQNLSQVGAALGVDEYAAQKRVSRALDKLRKFFAQRGVNSTTADIAGAISANSVQVVPAALNHTVAAAALAKGAAASLSTSTLIKGALKIMAWTKVKTAAAVGLGVLLAVPTTTLMVTKMQSSAMDAYLQAPELDSFTNAPPMVAIRPTHFAKVIHQGDILGNNKGTREIGRNTSLSFAILKAYGISSLSRMIYPKELDRVNVDYLVTVPDRPYEQFQAAIARKFGWTAHVETRDMDLLLLQLKRPGAPGLTPADNSSWEEWAAKHPSAGPGLHQHDITLARFAELIQGLVPKPVIDRTGMSGSFDFITSSFGPAQLDQVFLDQLGLELAPSREPLEVLVVEKVKG